jgi:hypothetical protein
MPVSCFFLTWIRYSVDSLLTWRRLWLIGILLLLRFLHLGTAADVFGLPAAPDPCHAAYNCGSGIPRTLNLSSFGILTGKLLAFLIPLDRNFWMLWIPLEWNSSLILIPLDRNYALTLIPLDWNYALTMIPLDRNLLNSMTSFTLSFWYRGIVPDQDRVKEIVLFCTL